MTVAPSRIRLPLLSAVAFALGCGGPSAVGSPDRSPDVSAALAQDFQLRPGETVELQGRGVRLTFVKVLEDSRCPIDAVCVWAGNATIQLHVRGHGEDDLELNTLGDTPTRPSSADFEGYRIRLVSLVNPNRASAERAPESSDYLATFRVETVSPG
jgi:hypothetical protein